MKITNVESETLNDVEKNDIKLKGKYTIVFDDNFAVHNIELREGKKGDYLIFPHNKYDDFLAYPISNTIREEIDRKSTRLNSSHTS